MKSYTAKHYYSRAITSVLKLLSENLFDSFNLRCHQLSAKNNEINYIICYTRLNLLIVITT